MKYSIDVTGPYQHFWKISYADVDGMKTSNDGNSAKHWTVTIGPVKKGFRASVKNAMGTGMNKIEVSKNNGPFALKASGEDSARSGEIHKGTMERCKRVADTQDRTNGEPNCHE